MNILFLSELFYPHGGGGELATYLYAHGLAEAGVKVNVVTNKFLNEPAKSRHKNLTIFRLPLCKEPVNKYSLLSRLDFFASKFAKNLLEWADVIYIPKYWYSAIPWAKSHGKAVVTHVHSYSPICPMAVLYDTVNEEICNRNKFCSLSCILLNEKAQNKSILHILSSVTLNGTIGLLFRRFIALSDAIICVSEAQRKTIISRRRELTDKTYVIYNPLPRQDEIPLEANHFGIFGAHNLVKGYQVLRCSIRHIKSKGIVFHATGFAEASSHCFESYGGVKIRKYERLQGRPYKEVYKKICAVVVPSVCPESWGYTITEALLRKRLVIASKIGGIPEQIEGCKGCFLFKPGQSRELADLIDFVHSLNRDELSSLGAANYESFLKRMKNYGSVARLLKICEQVKTR
jgi:glycosyltransferase involved in cell wall biosynthesis